MQVEEGITPARRRQRKPRLKPYVRHEHPWLLGIMVVFTVVLVVRVIAGAVAFTLSSAACIAALCGGCVAGGRYVLGKRERMEISQRGIDLYVRDDFKLVHHFVAWRGIRDCFISAEGGMSTRNLIPYFIVRCNNGKRYDFRLTLWASSLYYRYLVKKYSGRPLFNMRRTWTERLCFLGFIALVIFYMERCVGG